MTGQPELWDARCVMCGSLVGQVVAGSFVHDPNCHLPLQISGSSLRCCRCGGSLLKEATDERQTETTPLDQIRFYKHSKYRGR